MRGNINGHLQKADYPVSVMRSLADQIAEVAPSGGSEHPAVKRVRPRKRGGKEGTCFFFFFLNDY